MQTKERTRKGSIAAAAVAAALLLLAGLPARADHVPPGTAAFIGPWAEDGFIDAEEAAAGADRPVDWTQPDDFVATDAEAQFTDGSGVLIDPACSLGTVALTNDPAGAGKQLGDACMDAAAAALEDQQILFQVRWHDGTDWRDWVSSQPLVISIQLGTPAIAKPLAGSILPRESPATGTADPGAVVELFDIFDGADVKLTETTADSDGNWSVLLRLPSGHYAMQARVEDAAGNVALSDPVEFDVDGDAPDAHISSPAHLRIFDADDAIIVEGTAADLNDQEYGGVLAVEVNIQDALGVAAPCGVPNVGSVVDAIANGDPGAISLDTGCNLLVAQLGVIEHQQNAACTGCPAVGINEVSWIFDASFLGPGVWTFQVRTFDRIGNKALQPQQVTIVRLPVTIG